MEPTKSSLENMVRVDANYWSDRKVLITGHTGFKGSWLSLWLKNLGAEVTGVALKAEKDSLFEKLRLEEEIRHYEADISDRSAIEEIVVTCQPETVFHLAAQPLVRESYWFPRETWETNVMGTINLLEGLRLLRHNCNAVMVTTDKVYINREWEYGYREDDPLGGSDPYSSSKAGAEIALASWRMSFCGELPHQTPYLRIASARAGNVIGGGDWSVDRIIPDAMRALSKGVPIIVRNPMSTRPWQHVLEPISGYLRLAEKMSRSPKLATSFNFGPRLEANRSVRELVEEVIVHWPGSWKYLNDENAPHEAGRLNLVVDKAHHQLGWSPKWDFTNTVKRTVDWYRNFHEGRVSALECCETDLAVFNSDETK